MMNALHHLLLLNEDRDISLISEIAAILGTKYSPTHNDQTKSDVTLVNLASVLFARLLVILFAEVEGCSNNTANESQVCLGQNSQGSQCSESRKRENDVEAIKNESSEELPFNGRNDIKIPFSTTENPPKTTPGGKKDSVDSTLSRTKNEICTVATRSTNRSICTGISYLFAGEKNNETSSSLHNYTSKKTLSKIATTFSKFLNTLPHDETSSVKDDTKKVTPTVADVVSFCVEFIENYNDSSALWCGLCRALIRYRSKSDIDFSSMTIPQIVQDQLRYIISNFLKALLDEIRSCCEDYNDFLYIWECVAAKGSLFSPLVQSTITKQNSRLDDDNVQTKTEMENATSNKCHEIAWLLYIMVSLLRYPKGNIDVTNINENHRSHRILTIVSCISLLAFCSSITGGKKRTFDSNYEAPEISSPKRAKYLNENDQNFNENSTPSFHNNQEDHRNLQMNPEAINTLHSQSVVLNSSCPSPKNDAIAALSMMGSQGSGTSSGDETPPYWKHSCTSDQQVLEILLFSCNSLLSSLFPNDRHVTITASSLEIELQKVTLLIVKNYGCKLSPKNESFQQRMNALIKKGQSSEHCLTVKNYHQYLQHHSNMKLLMKS